MDRSVWPIRRGVRHSGWSGGPRRRRSTRADRAADSRADAVRAARWQRQARALVEVGEQDPGVAREQATDLLARANRDAGLPLVGRREGLERRQQVLRLEVHVLQRVRRENALSSRRRRSMRETGPAAT